MKAKVEFNVYRKDAKNPNLLEHMDGGSCVSIEQAIDTVKEYEKQGRYKKGGWVVKKTSTEYFEINN